MELTKDRQQIIEKPINVRFIYVMSQKRPLLPCQSWWFQSSVEKPKVNVNPRCISYCSKVQTIEALPISASQAQQRTNPNGPRQNSIAETSRKDKYHVTWQLDPRSSGLGQQTHPWDITCIIRHIFHLPGNVCCESSCEEIWNLTNREATDLRLKMTFLHWMSMRSWSTTPGLVKVTCNSHTIAIVPIDWVLNRKN